MKIDLPQTKKLCVAKVPKVKKKYFNSLNIRNIKDNKQFFGKPQNLFSLTRLTTMKE